MSVTRWISQDEEGRLVDVWSKKPVRRKGYFNRCDKTYDAHLCEKMFIALFPAAWAALDATRDANGIAGPIEVTVSIEPKGEGK